MDISITKQATQQAFSTIDGALESQPTGLSRLLLAYSPSPIKKILENGRLRLAHLRHREEELENTFRRIQDTKNTLLAQNIGTLDHLILRAQLEQLEKDYRLLSTVKRSLIYLEDGTDSDPSRNPNSETETLWWDLFEELASRRNEEWRVDLFARSLAINEKEPGAIRLKALWEIAMMEPNDFGCLSTFLDSSIYIDGNPVMLMESEEQYQYEPDLNEFDALNLALCVNSLIEKGFVRNNNVQFLSTEPVEIKPGSKVTYLIHKIKNLKNGEDTALRIEGISPTDYCLDLIRLYKPKLNIASERNFELLRDLLTDGLDFKEEESNIYRFVSSIQD